MSYMSIFCLWYSIIQWCSKFYMNCSIVCPVNDIETSLSCKFHQLLTWRPGNMAISQPWSPVANFNDLQKIIPWHTCFLKPWVSNPVAVKVQENPIHLQLSEPTSLANHFANPATDLARSAIAHLADFFGGWWCRNCHMSLGQHAKSCDMPTTARFGILYDTINIYIYVYIYIYNGYYTVPRHHLLQEMYKLRKGTQILVVFSHRSITLGNAHLSWHNYSMPIRWQCMKMLRLPVSLAMLLVCSVAFRTPSSRQVAECGNLLPSTANLRSVQSSWRRTLPSEALKWFQPKLSGVKWKAAGIPIMEYHN